MNGDSEQAIKNQYRLTLSAAGVLNWRNNVGVYFDTRGVPVRYGLANESKQMNSKVKSSDIIGIRTITITPDMVGKKVGLFFARETKKRGWVWSGAPEEIAQYRFISLVNDAGGDAAFYNGIKEYA